MMQNMISAFRVNRELQFFMVLVLLLAAWRYMIDGLDL